MNYEMIQVGYDVEKQQPIFEKREALKRSAQYLPKQYQGRSKTWTNYLTACES